MLLGQPVLAGTFADEDDDTDKVVVYPDSWRTVLVNAEVLKLFFTVSASYHQVITEAYSWVKRLTASLLRTGVLSCFPWSKPTAFLCTVSVSV